MVPQGKSLPLRLMAAGLLGLVLVSAPGCGKPKGTVTGTVKLKDGTVVSPGTTVTFWTSDGHSFPGAVANDGVYAVADIPTGEVTVTVVAPAANSVILPKEKDDAKPKPIVPINGKYKDRANTPLKTTVTTGKQEFPITLDP